MLDVYAPTKKTLTGTLGRYPYGEMSIGWYGTCSHSISHSITKVVRNLIKIKLNRQFLKRPSAEELVELGVLPKGCYGKGREVGGMVGAEFGGDEEGS